MMEEKSSDQLLVSTSTLIMNHKKSYQWTFIVNKKANKL